jgi:hypothetical protein
MEATRDTVAVVTHTAAYGAKLAAEKRGLPHIGIALQPVILMSAYDPPVVSTMPRLSSWIYRRGLAMTRAYIGLGKKVARR